MSHRLMITQSNYIPWKGFFDSVHSVDELILYDDMQFTRRDWRNRNRIKTPKGAEWLTVPVEVKGKYHQAIKDTKIADAGWGKDHWKTIAQNYARAPHFKEHKDAFEGLFLDPPSEYLSLVNRALIERTMQVLGIDTKVRFSSEFKLAEGKTERLVDLCVQSGATDYYSGPAARDYIVPELFEKAGVKLHYFDYSGYPPYPQLWGEFIHELSVLDLIFNTGSQATRYMKSFGATG